MKRRGLNARGQKFFFQIFNVGNTPDKNDHRISPGVNLPYFLDHFSVLFFFGARNYRWMLDHFGFELQGNADKIKPIDLLDLGGLISEGSRSHGKGGMFFHFTVIILIRDQVMRKNRPLDFHFQASVGFHDFLGSNQLMLVIPQDMAHFKPSRKFIHENDFIPFDDIFAFPLVKITHHQGLANHAFKLLKIPPNRFEFFPPVRKHLRKNFGVPVKRIQIKILPFLEACRETVDLQVNVILRPSLAFAGLFNPRHQRVRGFVQKHAVPFIHNHEGGGFGLLNFFLFVIDHPVTEEIENKQLLASVGNVA